MAWRQITSFLGAFVARPSTSKWSKKIISCWVFHQPIWTKNMPRPSNCNDVSPQGSGWTLLFLFWNHPTAGIVIFHVDSGMGRASQVGSRQIYIYIYICVLVLFGFWSSFSETPRIRQGISWSVCLTAISHGGRWMHCLFDQGSQHLHDHLVAIDTFNWAILLSQTVIQSVTTSGYGPLG